MVKLTYSFFLVLSIACFESCVMSGYVEYRPHYLSSNAEHKYYGNAVLDSSEFINTVKVLEYYGEEYKTKNDNVILITKSLANDWEIVWNYTLKANDTRWLNSHKPADDSCKPQDLFLLRNKSLQLDLIAAIDSVRLAQYPNGNIDSLVFVDLSEKYLTQFISDIDSVEYVKDRFFLKQYHFNIAPNGYIDPEECLDDISITFIPDKSYFRMVIVNTFLVEPDWCTESNVTYYFRISNGKLDFLGRHEAG